MKIFYILGVGIIVFLLSSCSSSDNTTSTSGGDIPTGEFKGRIILFDSTARQLSDASGAIVHLEGTTLTATTDAEGMWSFKDLPSRTYSISFTKPGFDTMRNTSYQFLGGGTVYYGEVNLQQQFHFTARLDGFVFQSSTGQGNIYYDFSADTPDSAVIQARLYFSNTPNIDPTDIHSYKTFFTEYPYFIGSNHSMNRPLYESDLLNFFKSRDTIYAKMYFGFQATVDQYLDVTTVRPITVGFGAPTNTLSTMLP
ncbi:MAG TPA: carboxypeptidase-like regulatory domain-containing protein [Candidatus Kapabacteria bacterium]|nr:carboxypeptidase-like regulatory domain-containing protein [Candidatus Kapabacteria bacterium]